jgi:hypothetical protein
MDTFDVPAEDKSQTFPEPFGPVQHEGWLGVHAFGTGLNIPH